MSALAAPSHCGRSAVQTAGAEAAVHHLADEESDWTSQLQTLRSAHSPSVGPLLRDVYRPIRYASHRCCCCCLEQLVKVIGGACEILPLKTMHGE